jgi:endonuclease I
MNHFYSILLTLISTFAFSQIPSNYYDSANGLTGYSLKTELKNIISNGHTDQGYDALYTAYVTTHSDNYYENDGSVLDFYSENPTGTDTYYYTHGNNQCGNYSGESDCYNREHIVPQSSFNENYPMRSDVHHVIPTDGYVNNRRSSYPFGTVGSTTWTSDNGSKVGSSNVTGYSGVVFEPIDEFKGDIARALLYFATRYENTVDGYTSFDMFNGTNDQAFETWAIDMLLDWHYNVDPVDQSEIDRNNAAFAYQGNANPFVDHPEYANMIWNPTPDTQAPTAPSNLVASNPTSSSIDLSWTASTDDVGVVSYDVYLAGSFFMNTGSPSTSYTATGLSSETEHCFTVYAKDAADNTSTVSNQACETTTAGGSGGSDCAAEDFEDIPANSTQYTDRTWSGFGGQWNATEARTDQTINGRAILIDCRSSTNGTITSPSISGGIGDLTITTQKIYTGTDGTLNVLVNGSLVGTIPYDATVQTTTISGINLSRDIVVTIEDNDSGSARIGIDDLSWTCYASLSVNDDNLSSIKIYPNPVSQNYFNIKTNQSLKVEIFNILGKSILKTQVNSNNSKIDIGELVKGIYLVKVISDQGSVTKKLIKQ